MIKIVLLPFFNFLMFILMSFSLIGQTQVVPYNQDFENGLNNWIQVSVSGNSVWEEKAYNSNGYAEFKGSAETNEDWLVSPQIDLTSSKSIKMSFELMHRYGTDTSNKLYLMVSTNYNGDVSTATWTELSFNKPASASAWNDPYSSSGILDLNTYKNQQVYMAFKVTSDGTSNATKNWRIDNVEIIELVSLPYNEDFETGDLGDWSSVQVSGGTSLWEYRNDAYGKYARIVSNKNHGSNTENWLVSPPLDLETLDKVELSFLSAYKWGTDTSNELTLWVTTNYTGDVTTTTWIELTYNKPTTADYQRYFSGIIDLNLFKSSGMRIAFKATSDGSSNATRNFHIDDISVTKNQFIANIPYIEDFENGDLGHWLPLSIQGENYWSYQSDANGNYAKINGNKNEGKPSKDWLISPAIDLDQPYDCELIFDTARKYGTDTVNNLTIWVSTNYNGSMYDAIWTELTYKEPKSNDYLWYQSGYIDLSAYKGMTVHLGFKATSDGSSNATRNFHIDNIQVKEKPPVQELTHLHDFENGSLDNWTPLRIAGNMTHNEWHFLSEPNGKYARIKGNKDEGIVSENWLISPYVNLDIGQASNLNFQMAMKYGTSFATSFSVLISKDYEGDVQSATWVNLNYDEPVTNDYVFYPSGAIDLSDFQGNRITIAFKVTYDGSSNATRIYHIDNIKIEENPFIIVPQYEDKFDQGNLSYWKTSNINGTTNAWSYHSYGFPEITGNVTTASENWLISPSVDLNIGDDVVLEFITAYKNGDDISNNLSLWISADYTDNVSTATWTELSYNKPNEGNYSWEESGLIDLSAYNGQTINIAFKAEADGTANASRIYFIDEIEFIPQTLSSGGPNILEVSVPSNWSSTSGSNLSINNNHYKKGSQSLKWNWQQGAILTVSNPQNISNGVNGHRGGMVLWVYNDISNMGQLTFQYESVTQVEYEFTFNLAFEGWRAIWVRFDEDMSGPKTNDNLITMKIKAPDNVSSGTLFFDKIEFGEFGRNDSSGYYGMSTRLLADYQMPFIDTDSLNHQLKLYHWDQLLPDIPLSSNVSLDEQTAFDEAKTRFTNFLLSSAPTATQIQDAKTRFNEFNIIKNGSDIKGVPIFALKDFVLEKTSTSYDPNVFSQKYLDDIILILAKDFKLNGANDSKQMYLDLVEHFLDQGFQAGSAVGSLFLSGYSFRNTAYSITLMKDELTNAGLFQKFIDAACWQTGIGELWETPLHIGADIDAFNITILPRFAIILALDDSPEKARFFKGITRWLNNALSNAPGTLDAIKVDGSPFHHEGFYPAYALGGYTNTSHLIYCLSGGVFSVDTDKHNNFNNSLYAMNLYSNKQWGLGISGRHPLDGYGVHQMETAFKNMALAGDPDTGAPINDKFAEAYVRLWGNTLEFTASPETIPNGNWSFNYGALGIHRWNEKMVAIKGYNKHVWSSELYQKENRYGRYLSYGAVQVIDTIGEAGSGFVENGFDWNRIPGTTIINRPIDILESPLKGSFLERSQEAFAGSLSFQGTHGAFGMVLRENSHQNFDDAFTARKSVFTFDDRIICLGSKIRNNTLAYPTETVLFQGHLETQDTPIWINSTTAETAFPYSEQINQSTDSWLLDAYNTGYYIPGNQTIKISRSLQQSKHKDTKRYNEGNYSAAWLDHGTAPRSSSYEYAMLLDTDATGIQNFHTQMQDPATELYHVYQQDSTAHIIKDIPTGIYGYSLFEPNTAITHGDLLSNSHPGLVMIKNNGADMTVSMVNPDLNLPNDIGKGTPDASVMVTVTLTVAGEWDANGTPVKYNVVSNTGNTVLEFECIEGLSVEANLVPKGSAAKSSSTFAISLDNNAVNENKPIYEPIGELSISSVEPEEIKFEIINNPQESFKIIDNKLVTNRILNFRNNNEYTIEVKATYASSKKKNTSLISSEQKFTINVLEGEKTLETVNFGVYPNPVENELLIENYSSNFKGELKIDVFSFTGQLLSKITKSSNQNTSRINFSNLPVGIYLVRIKQGGINETKKIIKK